MLTVQLSDNFFMLFEVHSILISMEIIVLMSVVMSIVIQYFTSYVSIFCLLMCITIPDNML